MNILIISGHGAGDPGACANGYEEADLTRELASELKAHLGKYAKVDIFDTKKNMYEYLKSGKVFNFKQYDYVIELHFNSSAGELKKDNRTTGTEIYVHNLEKGITVEEAILKNIVKLGFKDRGVKKTGDFLVMNTCKKRYGVSHALIEVCFINDIDDMKLYKLNVGKVAAAITEGVAQGFGLKKPKTELEQAVDKLVKAGIVNTPDYWLETAKSVKHLDTLIIKFAKTL